MNIKKDRILDIKRYKFNHRKQLKEQIKVHKRAVKYIEKYKQCPFCGSTQISEYYYGDVSLLIDNEREEASDFKIIFGGDSIYLDYNPKFKCANCETNF